MDPKSNGTGREKDTEKINPKVESESGEGSVEDTGFGERNEFHSDDTKWIKRLSELDENTQQQIAAKYYGGHMPWKKQKAENIRTK